jgi:hypothetical protein
LRRKKKDKQTKKEEALKIQICYKEHRGERQKHFSRKKDGRVFFFSFNLR